MKTIKSAGYAYQDEKSDKVYFFQIVEENGKYTVPFQFGKRNGTLQTQTKTPTPVSLEEAEKVFAQCHKEREKKQYKPINGTESTAGFSDASKKN